MIHTDTMELIIKNQQEQIKGLPETNRTLVESNQKLMEQTGKLQQKVQELLSQVAWLNRQLFGRKSEKLASLDPNRLALFDTLVNPRQEETDLMETGVGTGTCKPDGKKKESRRNRELLEGLPVVEVIVEPDNVDLNRYRRIGEERTRTLEFEPGKLYVKETVRPKYGLKNNLSLPKEGESGVIIAPLPPSPIYKCLAGPSLPAEILLQKYEYHVPFYRQVKEYRHLGVRLPESTLSGWFKPVCELLSPLYSELVKLVTGSGYVQVDETTVRVINKGKGKTDKEYLWMVRAVMERLVIFHYDDGSRSGQTIRNLLKDFKGYLQSDGYSAYNAFEGTKDVCLIACLAHIRRHMELALDENRSLAEYALKQIQELYHIEQIADARKLDAQGRCALRRRLATPILDSFEKWMEQTYGKVPPRSRMGQAITYTYPLWPRIKNYLKDGNLKIDNNLAENAIRPLTLSRKNFLFCGNHEAAENTAIICSLLATCKAQEINPREWLNDVIAKLPYYPEKDSGKNVRELLPDVWKLEKSNTNPIGV